ncbi:MAG: exodeoxyribonuclease V subunit gamma [Chitinivibrionales bacterium]
MQLYTSNRLEVLIDQLAKSISSTLSRPMQPETVVVESRGMQRYIALSLSRTLGICANIDFPFPNALIASIFDAFFPGLPERSPVDRDILTWRLFDRICNLPDEPLFDPIKSYIHEDSSQIKQFQLSRRIADTFDQYAVFRPDLIDAWETSQIGDDPDEQWQARLWNMLGDTQPLHRVALRRKLYDALAQGELPRNRLPSRVHVFGISSLPRFHMDIFAALSSVIDFRLFVLNPCGEFWDDIVSEKKLSRKAAKSSRKKHSLADMHMESGNPLLASLGDHGREFLSMLHDLDCSEHQLFTDQTPHTLLEHIQHDLLILNVPNSRTAVSEDDRSVQIHSSFSAMREVEVLHDHILRFLDEDPALSPSDIVVMTPDIETYAPCIQAVFESEQENIPSLPFSLADRPIRTNQRVIDDFLLLLDLIKSSFTAPDILALLESPAVQKRFSFTDSDISVVRQWIETTRIRWGIDKSHREQQGITSTHQNTWRAGMDRLFLSYAMGDGDERMVRDILPACQINSTEAITLGNLAEFLESLFSAKKDLSGSYTLTEWSRRLLTVADTFFAGSERDRSAAALTTILTDLSVQQSTSGCDQKIPLDVIRQQIDPQLTSPVPGSGFLSGGITFCSMLPMRSIPFRVVCVLGLNDRSYPRIDKKPQFDLTVRYPRDGDRNLRKDDRYLFLETILSARDVLYLSYTGRNADDNSDIPPSVVVSEMMDYIDRFYKPATKKHESVGEMIFTRHPLHPFSSLYFSADALTDHARLFSYSTDNYEAATSRLESKRRSLFLSGPAPLIIGKRKLDITIDEFCGFFRHPVRTFLRAQFGIRLELDNTIIESDEPFALAPLDKYSLEQFLLEKALKGVSADELHYVVRGMGILPHGTVGSCYFDRLVVNVSHVADIIRAASCHENKMYADVRIETEDYRLHGRLSQICANRHLRYRYAHIKPKDRIDTWIRHVILNAANRSELPRTTVHIGTTSKYVKGERRESEQVLFYSPVENAPAVLDNLIQLYRQGMQEVIRFFPESSHSYAESILVQRRYEKDALKRALQTWLGNGYTPGECEDSYNSLYFGEQIPLDKDFGALAMSLFEPLYDCEREGDLLQ